MELIKKYPLKPITKIPPSPQYRDETEPLKEYPTMKRTKHYKIMR